MAIDLHVKVAWWVHPYLRAAAWCSWIVGVANTETIVDTALEGVTFGVV